jgi:hypothetical protein
VDNRQSPKRRIFVFLVITKWRSMRDFECSRENVPLLAKGLS